MIPKWIEKVKPWSLKQHIKKKYVEWHIDKWNQDDIILNLKPISVCMREHITTGNYESSEIKLCSK